MASRYARSTAGAKADREAPYGRLFVGGGPIRTVEVVEMYQLLVHSRPKGEVVAKEIWRACPFNAEWACQVGWQGELLQQALFV